MNLLGPILKVYLGFIEEKKGSGSAEASGSWLPESAPKLNYVAVE